MRDCIGPNTRLYSFNKDTRVLTCPFFPKGSPGWNLVKVFFGGEVFPAQVRVQFAADLQETTVPSNWSISYGPQNADNIELLMKTAEPASDRILKSQQLVPIDAAYVLPYDDTTLGDIMKHRVLANSGCHLEEMRQHIKPNTPLFLLCNRTKEVLGPITPNGKPGSNLKKPVLLGGLQFSAQVRVLPDMDMKMGTVHTPIFLGNQDLAGIRRLNKFLATAPRAPVDILQAWGV